MHSFNLLPDKNTVMMMTIRPATCISTTLDKWYCLGLLLAVISHTTGAFSSDSFRIPSFLNGIDTNNKPTTQKPPSETQVIRAAQNVMANTGYFDPIDESLFSEDDFIFRGPVIGPLNFADYKEVLSYFSIYKAFPDIDPNCFGYTVDPENPLRVWFFVRATGTYQRPLGGPIGNLIRPDQQTYRGSPETWSLTFDDTKRLKAKLMTAGYVSDRFDDQATTDGAGLSFGILKTLGLDLPSGAGDYRLRLIQAINGPLVQQNIIPKAVSDKKDVPSWWNDAKRGADP